MALKIDVFTRNIEVDENLNDQIQKKVSGLERYLDEIAEARVEVVSTNARSPEQREAVQITVSGKGFILRAEERSLDAISALNMAVDTLQRRILKYKGKRNRRWKQGLDLSTQVLPEDEISDEGPQITRRKRFTLRPMDEWEAVEQMELLGHNNFFVFYNAKTESVNVLYKRYDGTLGLIQTEIG
jgi:putative sigma-54 modulation protein